jgi:DegV family protein with EDD domain
VARALGSRPAMPEVAVITDTCHYLPRRFVERHVVAEVPLHVHLDGEDRRESELDDYDAYYGRLRDLSRLPSTSQPSIGEFLAAYEPILGEGRDIVSVHLAGGISGTCESARQAREQLGDRASRVHVVDSATACGGEGLTVLAACRAAAEGHDGAEVAARAREARERLRMWFAVDTLEYLRRGGRIAGAQAWLGSALKIKPILKLESEITPVERVRTAGRAFERMVELMSELREAGADAWVVQHIQAPAEAERLAERGREVFGSDPYYISEIGPVIGTHVGPGLLGVGGVPSRYVP